MSGVDLMLEAMPQKLKKKLPALDLGAETPGQRISRCRKTRGLTQVELAEKLGITQPLLSSYESGRLRPSTDIVIRIALALKVSADEILGLQKASDVDTRKSSSKLLRRFSRIESLPPSQQKTVIRSIDMLLKGAAGA